MSIFAKRKDMEKLKSKDTALLIHIEHSQPIEIGDFVKTLNAVGGLFDDFVASNGGCDEMAKAKLYVEKIEHNCIDIHLCEVASAAMIPFMENVNIIIEFAKHIKGIVDFFANGKGEQPELTQKQLRNTHDLFSINAKDIGGNTSICAIDKSNNVNVYQNCNFGYLGSNSGQNISERIIQEMSTSEERNTHKRQLMKIYQVRSDMSNDTGNKAIIDNISPKKVNLCFDSDELKASVLNSDINPIKKLFLVDVVTQTVSGKLAAYKVTALHEIMDFDE